MGCALYSPYVLLALDMNHNALHCTAAEFVGEERRGGEMSGGRGGGGGGFKKKEGCHMNEVWEEERIFKIGTEGCT